MLIALCCAGCKPASIQTTHPMSEEQPSRKNRVCAIRCRLFLLGYSSNIGYSLAYAYKPASGTAYSSNPRAPSPRVPPVAPCARPAMRDKRSHVRRPALHSIFAARSMVGKIAARGYMFRSSRWGAPRLRAAALSSLPACAPSPLAGRNLPHLFHAPAARPRPNALTLIPPGFVLPLVALAPPRFSTARASLLPRFPSLAGLATLAPTQTHSRPLVGSATLRQRHASPRAGNMKRVGVVNDSGVQPKKTTRRRLTTSGCAGRAVRCAGQKNGYALIIWLFMPR